MNTRILLVRSCLAALFMVGAVGASSGQEAQEGSCGVASALHANSNPPGTPQVVEASSELSNPSVGFGLNGITDFSAEQPFIDIMKTGRPWIGHLRGQWGGWDHDDLASGGYLDEHGWPKTVPPELTAIETMVLTQLPADAVSISGRYRLTYEGTGTIEVNSMSKRWHGKRGEIWFEARPGDTMVGVIISRTDPEASGDYIRNIAIVKEENVAAFDAGAVFNPLWLEHMHDARLVRFMDWMGTNNSTQSEWAGRPLPTDYTYALRGSPVEVMIDLANTIGADPWFTMPHLATDQYMRCFAELVHTGLRQDLKAHVEFSNEVWNWTFGQARWAEDGGQARWGQGEKWMQYYAVRSIDMARIWDDVFSAAADDRLVKVISTQTGWLGLEADVLNPPMWIAENPAENKDVAQYFDAYAVTGYFGHSLGESKAPALREWIAQSLQAATEASVSAGLSAEDQTAYIAEHRFDEALETAARELKDGSVTGDPSGTLGEFLDNTLPYQANVAKTHGLDLIMYEGGTHVVGLGPVVEDSELVEFFAALNYSQQMADLYRDLLVGWKDAGGTVFNVFVDVATPSKWGSWGALRHLDDSNPRWDAIMDFNRDNPGWWEERPATSFLAGTAADMEQAPKP